MTCIVGLVDGKNVYMGADSSGISGYDLMLRKDKKIFKKSNDHGDLFLIAFSNSFRMGQILKYCFEPPPHLDFIDIHEYMVKDFVSSVRESFTNHGVYSRKDEVEDGWILVGIEGRLFTIEPDCQVAETTLPYYSIGCGDSYAKGAMFSNHHLGDPKKRIIHALECSERFSAGVRGPFVVESI